MVRDTVGKQNATYTWFLGSLFLSEHEKCPCFPYKPTPKTNFNISPDWQRKQQYLSFDWLELLAPDFLNQS